MLTDCYYDTSTIRIFMYFITRTAHAPKTWSMKKNNANPDNPLESIDKVPHITVPLILQTKVLHVAISFDI